MANRRTATRRSTVRRGNSWAGAAVRLQVTAAAPTFVIMVSEAELEMFPNPTLVRQRGRILVYAQAGGATLDSVCVLGMYFANAAAITAGVAALQSPGTDSGSDCVTTIHIRASVLGAAYIVKPDCLT